jgi:hypothetical protein
MLAAINYMTYQAHFFNIGLAAAIGHLGGALLTVFVLPDQDVIIISIVLVVGAGFLLAVVWGTDFDVTDEEETERAGSGFGTAVLMVLCVFLFHTTVTEEPLAADLPTGESTMGWGSTTAYYWHIISAILAFVALVCGNCADLGPKKIIGFATGFSVAGYLALADFEDRNANIAGFFTSLSLLSVGVPLGKFGSLAALQELRGPGPLLTLYYGIGAALRCAGSVWVIREITLANPVQAALLIAILAACVALFIVARNSLSWYDIEHKKIS